MDSTGADLIGFVRDVAFRARDSHPVLRRIPIDDLIQIGWVAALEARPRFDPNRGVAETTFLHRRVLGAMQEAHSMAYWRTRRMRPRPGRQLQPLEETPEACEVPDADHLDAVEDRVDLREALAVLDERSRYVLGQFYFAERKMTDIGRDLGIGEAMVSRIHTAALARLRRRLG